MIPLAIHEIEIWCDVQVEGFQAINVLADIAREQGFDVTVDLLQGHIPRLVVCREELQTAGYEGPNITVCLEAVYNQETGVISTNYSVVGDDSRAIQALMELISGVREA